MSDNTAITEYLTAIQEDQAEVFDTWGLGDADLFGSQAEIGAQRLTILRLTSALQAVVDLAEAWRYKGEFGYDDGSHAYGPDEEGYILDRVSSDLRRVIEGALGRIENGDDL